MRSSHGLSYLTPKTKRLNMIIFSIKQRINALFLLSFFQLLVITSSNYLVQLPISIFGFHTTWGAFSFPCILLTTDLTVRIFGTPLARRIILIVMIPALFISYFISCVFYQGTWQGWAALGKVNLCVARIAFASFLAYVLSQILDIHVFNRLRKLPQWWIAPVSTVFLSNIIDTLAFFFIAFYKSQNHFMAIHWMEIAMVDYCFKVLIFMILFMPTYKILLNITLKHLVYASGKFQFIVH